MGDAEDPGVDEIVPVWMKDSRKKRPEDNWQLFGAMMLLLESKNREASERREYAAVKGIVRDLRKMQTGAERIRHAIGEIERNYAEAHREKTPGGLLNFVNRLLGRLGASEPAKSALQDKRQEFDDMLAKVDAVSNETVAALVREFKALSILHPTARRGFMRRLGCYETIGYTERDIAKMEDMTIGAVHSARQRFKRAGGLKSFREKLEEEGSADDSE